VTPNTRRHRGRVLLIEDDPDVIETMEEMLTGLGYHVRTAEPVNKNETAGSRV